MKFVLLLLHFGITFINSIQYSTTSQFPSEAENSTLAKLELSLIQFELNFSNYFSNQTTTNQSYSLNYIRTVRDIANELCHYISNESISDKAVTSKSTKIHVSCILPTHNYAKKYTGEIWKVETQGMNTSATFFKAKTGDGNWTHCYDVEDENADTSVNCHAVVQYNLPLNVDRLGSEIGPNYWEAFLIIDGENFLDISNTLYKTFQVSMQFEKVSGHNNATCGRLTDEFGGWDTRICKTTVPSTNPCVIECNCDGNGFFKIIYLDLLFNNSVELEQRVSFWINSTYKATWRNRTCIKDLANSFLTQIVTQLGFESMISDSAMSDTVVLDLGVTKTNISVILTFKNLEMWNNGSFWNSTAISKFISKLDTALIAGTLKLKDFKGVLLSVPIQKLTNITSVEKISNSLEPESVFLWVVFVVVILATFAFIVIAVRKHKQEAEDTVRPITYQAENFHSPSDTSAVIILTSGRSVCHSARTGIEEIFPARSMTTILSDSLESFDSGRGGSGIRKRSIGNGSIETQESLSPPQENARYEVFARPPTQANVTLPHLIDDDDDMDRIYYIPPPSEDNDYLPPPM